MPHINLAACGTNSNKPPPHPQYDKDGRLIVVDIKKEIGERVPDLSLMTYYMEKDVRHFMISIYLFFVWFCFVTIVKFTLP